MRSALLTPALLAGALWAEPVTWGNATGRILDHGRPAAASVCVASPRRCALTDGNGSFALSGIPLESWEGGDFDLRVATFGHTATLSRLRVPAGAMLAPRLEFDFTRSFDTTVEASLCLAALASLYEPSQPIPLARTSSASSATVYATREGLVGLKTANGHVIVANDHFVALPSRRALNRSDSPADLEFEVQLERGSRTARLPVWDVGPWNTTDDWWNPTAFRQSWKDLATGMPQAQAAFAQGYNQGLDGSGRAVRNQAGIDLADGAFWQDLGMLDNGAVGVTALWQLNATVGTRVQARHWAKVRAAAGGTVLDTVDCGQSGTVVAGPDSATVSGHWYLFYRVQWTGAATGWSAENFLTTEALAECSDALHPATAKPSRARIVGDRLVLDRPAGPASFEVFSTDGRLLMGSGTLLAAGSWTLPGRSGLQVVVVRSGSHRQILTRAP